MFHVRVTKIDPLNYGFEYLGMFADSHMVPTKCKYADGDVATYVAIG